VIVQAPIWVRIHETVDIDVPAEGAEQIIALQVRLPLLTVDETTGQTGGEARQ